MPKLLLFAPCERLIVEHGANTVSLISVLQEITVPVAPAAEGIPPDLIAATTWYVVALWLREDGEDPKRMLRQRAEVESPNGKVVLRMLTEFDLSRESHRNINVIQGLPVGVPGRYQLKLALTAVDEDNWVEIASYPFFVKHSAPPTS